MTNSELITIDQNGQPVASSRDVAEHFEKEHKHVLRDIENLIGGLPNFGHTPPFYKTTYIHPQNGQTYPMYLMNRDGFTLLAMGFTGKTALEWKLKYIEAFNTMEQELRQKAARPLSPAEQLLAQAQLMVEQEKRLSAVETRQTELAERCGENGRKLDTLTAVIVEPYASEQDWQERIGRTIRAAVAQYGLNYRRFYAELYDELERTAGVSLKSRQTRLKKRMLAAGSTKSQCGAVTKLYVISMDKKLRPLMESILRRRILEYAAAKPAAVR